MSTRAALATGTVLSAAVTSAWAQSASLTIGPAAPLHLGRNMASDYAQLAAAPAGNGRYLFAVVAFTHFACLLISGWRRYRTDGAPRRRGGGS